MQEMEETWVRSLGGEYPPKEEMATHSSTLVMEFQNPMDRGSWWAMVHRVKKSQTCLKQPSTHTPKGPQPRSKSDSRMRQRQELGGEAGGRYQGLPDFPQGPVASVLGLGCTGHGAKSDQPWPRPQGTSRRAFGRFDGCPTPWWEEATVTRAVADGN